MFKMLGRVWRFLPLVVGLVLVLRRGKKDAALEDAERDELNDDIEAFRALVIDRPRLTRTQFCHAVP